MAYHPGIPLVTVTVGGASTLESGEPLGLTAEITASRSLLYVVGNVSWQYDSDKKVEEGALGSELTFTVPPCDIPGLRTKDNEIIDVSTPGSYTHSYNIRVSKYRMAGGKRLPVGQPRDYTRVVLPTAGGPFDLDTMQPVATVAGGVVLVPDSWNARVAAAEAAAVAAEAAAVDAANAEDATVASHVGNAASATRTALGGLYAPLRSGGGRRWGFVGDSNTEGSYTTSFARSYVQRTIDIAGHDVCRPDSLEFGTSGWTSTQIMNQFISFQVGGSSEAFVILAGSNDVPGTGGSIPAAITTATANLTTMCEAARKAGKKVVLCTVPPRTAASAVENRRFVAAINAWIRLNATRLGAELADHYGAVADVADGNFIAAYTTDGVHYNDQGAMRVAQVTAEAMRRCFPEEQSLTARDVLYASLVADAMNTRADALTSGWVQVAATGTTPTYAMETDTTGFLDGGKWASVQANGSSGALVAVDSPNILAATYAPADVLAVVGKAQAIVTAGDWVTNVGNDTAGARFRVMNSVSAELAAFKVAGRDMGGGRFDIGPFIIPFTIAATEPSYVAVRTYLHLNTGVDAKLRWQFTVVNLTALGISTLAPSATVSRP